MVKSVSIGIIEEDKEFITCDRLLEHDQLVLTFTNPETKRPTVRLLIQVGRILKVKDGKRMKPCIWLSVYKSKAKSCECKVD